MSKVTVLGMGAMGSRMAANLIAAGHSLTVWNRTPERTQPLADQGATAAQTPAEAVAEAEVVISIVRDDNASSEVWLDPEHGALAALRPKAIAIESSTLTVKWVRQLAGQFAEAGIAFLDAPVAGSRPQAEAAQLIFLVGGDKEVLECVRPILDSMGRAVHHAGPSGSGAGVKLMVNALLLIQVATIGELIGLARAADIDEERAIEIVMGSPVASPAAKGLADMMLASDFDPRFPVEMVEKDLSYVVETAGAGDTSVPMTEAAREVFANAIEEGLANLNMTAVVKRYAD